MEMKIIREGRRSYTTIERILFLLSHFIGGAECYAGRTCSVEMLVVYDVMCIRSMYATDEKNTTVENRKIKIRQCNEIFYSFREALYRVESVQLNFNKLNFQLKIPNISMCDSFGCRYSFRDCRGDRWAVPHDLAWLGAALQLREGQCAWHSCTPLHVIAWPRQVQRVDTHSMLK
jgi:hypothetical protein